MPCRLLPHFQKPLLLIHLLDVSLLVRPPSLAYPHVLLDANAQSKPLGSYHYQVMPYPMLLLNSSSYSLYTYQSKIRKLDKPRFQYVLILLRKLILLQIYLLPQIHRINQFFYHCARLLASHHQRRIQMVSSNEPPQSTYLARLYHS